MQAQFFTFKKTQLLAVAIASVTQAFCNSTLAAPEGAQVVAGEGAIEQIEKETRVQQASERLSIDWKSFDINSDERVQFIQPTTSSIAINRILSNKGSLIQGRIDANGQVVLINPNGLIFTEGASVNAGGLIASALQMSDQDYLNGRFTLNALEGSEGRVINSGLLNAATGGNISLIGQSVENKGLISANLGSVNLAAGKEAVLTFEPNGLLGVKITQASLQQDLGVDAALINSGEIKAEGGKVLLTASVSQDVFTRAVNQGELKSAKSAVVNADGSFTLGGGADVINTGQVNVNGKNASAGEAVIIGGSVTNSGQITADGKTQGGHIELNSTDKTEIVQQGKVTAQSSEGAGGDIKLLGNKVGVVDKADVNASGRKGGGQVLLGGDQSGKNPNINNAEFLFVGEDAEVHADANELNNGGRIIAFALDTARIYGELSVKGGLAGSGGFVETSGLQGLEVGLAPDITALSKNAGHWLIDPYDIVIDGNSSPS
ncbi:MAG TPA: filamentous hemagglutinin N-terminal domain-containing protein, partial [Cellvibrionaceae bacterium]|nr:filamentous hemagglutinin N-terminal domain-containing protein [Cellvibrionaceae bacterium]